MKLSFVAMENDKPATDAVNVLAEMGYPARYLNGEDVSETEIAIFTSQEGKYPGKHVRMCPWQLEVDGFNVPEKLKKTPFLVALKPIHQQKHGQEWQNRVKALREMAERFESWNPHVKSGFIGPVHVSFDSLGEDTRDPALKWQDRVLRVIEKPGLRDVLDMHLNPIFSDARIDNVNELVVMGCAPFNKPHTDVDDKLLPEKAQAVVDKINQIIDDAGFDYLSIIIPDSAFLEHEALRKSLHPFLFMDVGEVEEKLGYRFVDKTRLWDRTHVRSDAEIAEALDAGAQAIKQQIALPLSKKAPCKVQLYSWTDLLGEYLDNAWQTSSCWVDLAKSIYYERVRDHVWYSWLHQLDPQKGLDRTMGNNAVYIAVSELLANDHRKVVVDFEVDEQFWKRLQPILRGKWSDRVPYIGSVPQAIRQPWSY